MSAVPISVPGVGESISEGILAKWLAADGSAVKAGDPLFELETDKATNVVPAPASGVLKVQAAEGDTVAIGSTVGVIDPSAAPAEAKPKAEAPRAAEPAPAASNTAESAAGILAMAQKMHDDYVSAGVEQRDKIIAEAQIEASGLVTEAQEKSRKILSSLEQQKALLERKVEQLRGFERDYRSRLKAYIEGQLRDLDSRGSVASETADA